MSNKVTDELMELANYFADAHVRLETSISVQSVQIGSHRVDKAEEALRTAITQALAEAREEGARDAMAIGFSMGKQAQPEPMTDARQEALNAANRMMRAAIKLEDEQAHPEPVAVVYERAQGSFGITCLKPVWSGMKLYDHHEQAQPIQKLRPDFLAGYDEGMKDMRRMVDTQIAEQAQPCAGGDPLCPCKDGDACHYQHTKKTKAWPVPHRVMQWGFCPFCGHDRIPGEGCSRTDCPDAPRKNEEKT